MCVFRWDSVHRHEQEAMIEEMARKRQLSDSPSHQAKFRYYSTVVRLECLYVGETVASKGFSEIKKKEKTFKENHGTQRSLSKLVKIYLRPNQESMKVWDNSYYNYEKTNCFLWPSEE